MAATIIQIGAPLNASVTHVKLQVFCSCLGQIAVNTGFYSLNFTTGVQISSGDLAAAFSDWIRDAYLPCLNQDARYLGVKCTGMTPGKPLPGVAVEEGNGTEASNALPEQTSGVLTFQTLLSDAQGRGRLYIPFPALTHQDADGRPTVDYQSSLALLGIGWRAFVTATIPDGPTTVALGLKVFSRTHNIYRDCVSVRGNRRWGTQRRRGNYGQTNFPFIT